MHAFTITFTITIAFKHADTPLIVLNTKASSTISEQLSEKEICSKYELPIVWYIDILSRT